MARLSRKLSLKQLNQTTSILLRLSSPNGSTALTTFKLETAQPDTLHPIAAADAGDDFEALRNQLSPPSDLITRYNEAVAAFVAAQPTIPMRVINRRRMQSSHSQSGIEEEDGEGYY